MEKPILSGCPSFSVGTKINVVAIRIPIVGNLKNSMAHSRSTLPTFYLITLEMMIIELQYSRIMKLTRKIGILECHAKQKALFVQFKI